MRLNKDQQINLVRAGAVLVQIAITQLYRGVLACIAMLGFAALDWAECGLVQWLGLWAVVCVMCALQREARAQ